MIVCSSGGAIADRSSDAANRWELARGPDGAWLVERRVNRLMSGSAESRALLARGLDPSG